VGVNYLRPVLAHYCHQTADQSLSQTALRRESFDAHSNLVGQRLPAASRGNRQRDRFTQIAQTRSQFESLGVRAAAVED
jgi:hypothetical protein